MTGILNIRVQNSAKVSKCTRRMLFVLIIACTGLLLVENDILLKVYSVYTNRTHYFNAATSSTDLFALITNSSTLQWGKNLRSVQQKLDASNNYATASSITSGLNTSRNSSSDKTQAVAIQYDPSNSSEIRHTWEKRKKGSLDIFILSAIGTNSSETTGYRSEIKLNGWQALKHKYVSIKCCILWSSGGISEYFNPNRTHQKKQLSLLGCQIACPVPRPLNHVKGITLQFARKPCTEDKSDYLQPLVPAKPAYSDSFVICLKLLYGNIEGPSLIYWIEYYVEMKVDKIFTFTYNISAETEEILNHYYMMGILEWRQFDFPWKGGRSVGQKVPVFWEDEQVVIYDSFARFHSYTYFAIIDLDEYLVPKRHEDFKDMMKYLVSNNPNASGFQLMSYIFNKNWGVSGSSTGPDVEKYILRTHVFSGAVARPKNILLPSRIQFDSQFHTHKFTPKPGYESILVNESFATINHYRECYFGLKRACDHRSAVNDTGILKFINRIKIRTQWFSKSQENG